MYKALLFSSLLLSPLAVADEVLDAWKELAVVSQNTGYRIHMMGVDSGDPDPKSFEKQITKINKNLDLLVKKGVLVEKRFELRPNIDLQESLIKDVEQLVGKYAPKYGIYTIREMMDVGARQYLSEFDDNSPVFLQVRMPEDFLTELEAILKDNGYQKQP